MAVWLEQNTFHFNIYTYLYHEHFWKSLLFTFLNTMVSLSVSFGENGSVACAQTFSLVFYWIVEYSTKNFFYIYMFD